MMSKLPFSKTRNIGSTLYLSGEIGFSDDGSIPSGIEQQTENCINRIKLTLQEAGLSLANVISCTCYLTDAADFATFNATYAKFFPDPMPVRTTVLAELLVEAKVEITIIADSSGETEA